MGTYSSEGHAARPEALQMEIELFEGVLGTRLYLTSTALFLCKRFSKFNLPRAYTRVQRARKKSAH